MEKEKLDWRLYNVFLRCLLPHVAVRRWWSWRREGVTKVKPSFPTPLAPTYAIEKQNSFSLPMCIVCPVGVLLSELQFSFDNPLTIFVHLPVYFSRIIMQAPLLLRIISIYMENHYNFEYINWSLS